MHSFPELCHKQRSALDDYFTFSYIRKVFQLFSAQKIFLNFKH